VKPGKVGYLEWALILGTTNMGALLTFACEAMLHDATGDLFGEAALQR
jgi:hypothetical protein